MANCELGIVPIATRKVRAKWNDLDLYRGSFNFYLIILIAFAAELNAAINLLDGKWL